MRAHCAHNGIMRPTHKSILPSVRVVFNRTRSFYAESVESVEKTVETVEKVNWIAIIYNFRDVGEGLFTPFLLN